jgi:hypothetical protein
MMGLTAETIYFEHAFCQIQRQQIIAVALGIKHFARFRHVNGHQ